MGQKKWNWKQWNWKLPLKILSTAECNSIMDWPHRDNDLVFNFSFTNNIKSWEEVTCNSNQSVFRPSLQPVDCTATDETRKLQGSAPELLSNLEAENYPWRELAAFFVQRKALKYNFSHVKTKGNFCFILDENLAYELKIVSNQIKGESSLKLNIIVSHRWQLPK